MQISGEILHLQTKIMGGEPEGQRVHGLVNELRRRSLPKADIPTDFYHLAWGGKPVRHHEHVAPYVDGGILRLDLVITEVLQPRSYAWRLWKANTRGSQRDLLLANKALRQRFRHGGSSALTAGARPAGELKAEPGARPEEIHSGKFSGGEPEI